MNNSCRNTHVSDLCVYTSVFSLAFYGFYQEGQNDEGKVTEGVEERYRVMVITIILK